MNFKETLTKTTNFLNEIPQKIYLLLLLFLDNIAFTKAKNIQCEFMYYYLCNILVCKGLNVYV